MSVDYKIGFYVPKEHKEPVKKAMFKAGGGQIGNYDCCCWETLGTGQFRPLKGSKPFLGNQNVVETVDEYRVEMVCTKEGLHDTVKAMIEAHPYEEPAYDIVELVKL